MLFKRIGKFVAAFGLAASFSAAAAAEIAGHYIDYAMKFTNLPGGAQGSGTWQMGIAKACPNWIVTQLNQFNVAAGKGSIFVMMTMTGTEATDGVTGKYEMNISISGQKLGFKANAKLAGLGKAGTIEIAGPAGTTTANLPAGVMLMVPATLHISQRLAAGAKEIDVKVVDPSDPSGYAEWKVTVLADPSIAPMSPAEDDEKLLQSKSWPVKVVVGKGGQSTEATMRIHENGITSQFKMEMAGIGLDVSARKVMPFPNVKCN